MPEPRTLTAGNTASDFDEPPATSEPSYPNRHSRLRRALRDTSALAREIARDVPVTGSNAVAPSSVARRTTLNRARRRAREAEQDDEDEHNGYGSAFTSNADSERRFKRRKLDTDSTHHFVAPIKYGHYGQVEPGNLQMDIISHDGGEHIDPSHPTVYLGAKNILKLDQSVYCTERSSVSIMLGHTDGTPFTLEKLHIIGPEHGFTAPVREGIVYVAMDIPAFQPYLDPPCHARRSSIHEPPYSRQRSFRASPERLTLSDALRDPEINTAARTGVLPSDEHASETPALESGRVHLPPDLSSLEPYCDPLDYFDSTADMNMPTAVMSDEELEPDEVTSQEVLDYRISRIRQMQRRYDYESSSQEDQHWSRVHSAQLNETARELERQGFDNPWQLRRLETIMRNRSRAHLSPTLEEAGTPAEPNGESSAVHASSSRAAREGSSDPNVTMARFAVTRGKHKVALKFVPPVSGRYVLLKLWSGRSNVDVQSVVVKGFAGPRFFPAIEPL